VRLTWDEPIAGANTVTGYRVYRNNANVGGLLPAGTLSFTDTGLVNHTNYIYFVRAERSSTLSERSNVVEATPAFITENPVRELLATHNDSNVVLSWKAPELIINEGWFTHSFSTTSSGVNVTNRQVLTVQRFTPHQLIEENVAGGVLTHVETYVSTVGASYNLRIWTGGSGMPLNPGTLIHTQAFSGNVSVAQTISFTLLPPIYRNSNR
jgi:hypothetical protein